MAALRFSCLLFLMASLAACGTGTDEPTVNEDGTVGIDAEAVALDAPLAPRPTEFLPTLAGKLRPLSLTPNGPMKHWEPNLVLSVTFSQPMTGLGENPPLPPEGTLTLAPAVPGTYQWRGSQTLIFIPSEPLLPATPYEATLHPTLRSLAGNTLDEPHTWTFETPRPRLLSVTPRQNERNVSLTPTIRLVFNMPMARASAADHLYLDNGREMLDYDLSFESDSILLMTPARPLEKGTRHNIQVRATLPPQRGTLGLERERTYRFSTFEELALVSVTQPDDWERESERGLFSPGRGITFRFNTPVKLADLFEALTFDPPVTYPAGTDARAEHQSGVHSFQVNWQANTRYTVSVDSLTDVFGQMLVHAEQSFRTRDYDPKFTVPSDLLLVEAEEQAALPIRAINVDDVRMQMARLTPEEIIPNLHHFDRSHGYFRNDRNNLPLGELPPLDLGLERNQPRLLPLRMDSVLTGGTGIVALHAHVPAQRGWRNTRNYYALAQVTRLGITAKFSPHQNLVFVSTLKDAQPVPEATVTIRGLDGAVRWTGLTDADGKVLTPGWAELGMDSPNEWSNPVQFAFAEKDGDLAFTASLYDDGLEPYRFGVRYDWQPTPRTEAGSVFSDRGLYRAGETVYLKAILRQKTDADWYPLTDSVRVRIRSPRDEFVLDERFAPSDLGTFDLDWAIPASADQGVYSVQVAFAAEQETGRRRDRNDIATGTFRVDAFRRATFAVTATSAAPSYVAGDFFEGSIEGRYLFGAPMSGQPVRYTVRREQARFEPPGFEAFSFGKVSYYDYYYDDEYGYYDRGGYQQLASGEATLDEDGLFQTRVALRGNDEGKPARVVLEGSVTDPARQVLSGSTEALLHPGLFYIGLRPSTRFLDLTDEDVMAVNLITVDPQGRSVGEQAVQVSLVREQWNSVREVGSDGRLRWRSRKTEIIVGQEQVRTEAGKALRLRFKVPEGGSYYLRATATDLRGNTIRTETYFYATGRGYVAWARNDDDRIELIGEKSTYAPGETAKIMVQSPYEEATALVTVEREGIISSRVTRLVGSAPQIEIPLTEAHLPNAFVSVILLHGRTAPPEVNQDPGAPSFKIGYLNLNVDPNLRHLRVEVQTDQDEFRPGEEITVNLRLRNQEGDGVAGEIAFSAADAGVLNLIGYALPDPFDAFYGPRPLGVTTSESRANLVEQRNYGQKAQDEGGGGGDGSDQLRKDFRPLAHWAPAVRTDDRGRASLTFRLPESLTTFRLMAAALTGDNLFGQGQTDIVVTKPLVLQPALPRFTRLDDRFEAGVLVTNTTGAAGEVTVSAQADGLTLTGPTRKTLTLANGETKEVRFGWAVNDYGAARLTFAAELDEERDAFEWPLPISLPVTKNVAATFASTEEEATEALQLPPGATRVPGLGTFTANASSTALVGLDGAAQYLFSYPYGCLEQRTSRIRPLLLAEDLVQLFDVETVGGRQEAIEEWIAGLRDYWAGEGYSLWKGGRQVNRYVTSYVLLAMAEARDAGFSVPAAEQARVLEAVEQYVRNRSDKPRYYSMRVWDETRAMMLFALARHGRILDAEINSLAEGAVGNTAALGPEGVSYLLRTILLADRLALRRYQEPLLQRLRSAIRTEATTAYLQIPNDNDYWWIFASNTRATAFGLTALAEAEPSDDLQLLAQRMVRYLIESRKQGHWASTQENAAVIDGLRAYVSAYEQAEPDFQAAIQLAGRRVLEETFQGRSLGVASAQLTLDDLPEGTTVPVTVAKEGTGRLYYSLRLETYSNAPLPAVDNGLRVARTIQRLDERGQPQGTAMATGGDTLQLQAGDLVRVTLRLTSPSSRNYVVVDDALPAGLEALNTAFETTNQEALENTGSDQWWGSFNYTQIQDDRVLLFADYLRRGEHTYTYVARATTPGTFVHPAAQAELMYQPDVNGRNATGALVVQAPPAAGVAAR